MSKVAKSARSRSDTAVQGTNDHSIVSKSSVARLGYVNDDYLKYFVQKKVRRAPLINRGYYIRFVAMDACYHHFINSYQDCKKQILVMGAGFDSSYFRLKASGMLQDTLYIEVDFPDLVKRKTALIQQTTELSVLLPECIAPSVQKFPESTVIGINTDSFKLIGADLTKQDALNSVLRCAGWDPQLPTLCLSEVVLAYMAPGSSSSVIKWAADTLPNAMFALFEQIVPGDAFGLIMQAHFKKIGSPLKSLNMFPTIESQISRFQSLGWELAEATDLSSLKLISEEEWRRIDDIEPFDEFEEWHSYCNHYLLLTAFRGSCCKLAGHLVPTSSAHPKHHTPDELDAECISVTNRHQMENMSESGVGEESSYPVASQLSTIPSGCQAPGAATQCRQVPPSGTDTAHHSCGSANQIAHSCGHVTSSSPVNCDNDADDACLCDTTNVCDRTPVSTDISAECPVVHWSLLEPGGTVCQVFGHSCVMLNDDMLLCTGGFEGHNEGHGRHSDVVLFNTVTDVSCRVSVGQDSLRRQFHTMTLLHDGSILVYGGRSSPVKPASDVVLIKVISDAAQLLKSPPDADVVPPQVEVICCHGDAPSPRWRHSAAQVTLCGSEHVCIFGGRDATNLVLSDGYLLDTKDYHWTKLTPVGDLPCARHSHTADVVGDRMYIAAGLGASQMPLNTVHMYSFTHCRWSQLGLHGHLRSRYSHTSAVVDDKLLLLGGSSRRNPAPGLAVIDLQTLTVQEYSLPHQDPARPILLHNHVSVLTKEKKLLMLGGGGNCFSFGTHFNSVNVLVTIPGCDP